jgi:hypothetical protein
VIQIVEETVSVSERSETTPVWGELGVRVRSQQCRRWRWGKSLISTSPDLRLSIASIITRRRCTCGLRYENAQLIAQVEQASANE